MTIEYSLMENKLHPEAGKYTAVVHPASAWRMEELVREIVEHGSTVTEADVRSVLVEYYAAIKRALSRSHTVVTPIANYSISIRGLFDGLQDGFDVSRHEVRINVQTGSDLRGELPRGLQPQKVESSRSRPNPQVFTDMNSGQQNSVATSGGLGKLAGRRLKFDEADPQQGIFFRAQDGTLYRVATVAENRPSTLIFAIPNLPEGDYGLEVRALAGSTRQTGTLKETLSAA